LAQQWTTLFANLQYLALTFFLMPAIVIGAIVLLALSNRATLFEALRKSTWLLLWPVLACSAYALIHVEPRFIAPFALLFWLSIYGVLIFRVPGRTRMIILVPVLALAMLFTVVVAISGAGTLRERGVVRQPDYQVVGEALRSAGVREGDYLAVVGNSFDAYYARYARARVVAQIPDADEFRRLSKVEVSAVADHLAAVGVKAIVARNRMESAPQASWREVNANSAQFHILILPDPSFSGSR
jgi:hypothetical protein